MNVEHLDNDKSSLDWKKIPYKISTKFLLEYNFTDFDKSKSMFVPYFAQSVWKLPCREVTFTLPQRLPRCIDPQNPEYSFIIESTRGALAGIWTHDLWVKRPVLYHWATYAPNMTCTFYFITVHYMFRHVHFFENRLGVDFLIRLQV